MYTCAPIYVNIHCHQLLPQPAGDGAEGLGYAGIANSLAVRGGGGGGDRCGDGRWWW